MSEYYTATGIPVTASQGSSQEPRNEFLLIEQGFDLMPTLSGNGDLPVFVNSTGTAQEAISASSARTKLGLVIGTNVQAYDAGLKSIADLSLTAGKIIYTTATDTFAAATITAAGLAIIDDADASAQRTTLGLAEDDDATFNSVTTSQVSASGGVIKKSAADTDLTIEFTNSTEAMSRAASGLTIAGISNPKLATMSYGKYAFLDDTNADLRVYKITDTGAFQVGGDTNLGTVANSAICAMSATRVAVLNSSDNDLEMYDWNGNTFTLVGSALNITGVTVPAICSLSYNVIAMYDSGNQELRTYRFNGSTWSLVGSGLAIASGGIGALAGLSPYQVAFIDVTNADLRHYSFDGSNWSLDGNELNVSGVSGDVALTALSQTRIAFIDDGNADLRVYDWDGTDWSQYGNDENISGATSSAICAVDSVTVVHIDDANDSLRLAEWSDGTLKVNTGGLDSRVFLNADMYHLYKWMGAF